MVRIDIHTWKAQMSFVNPIRAVDAKFMRGELFDIRADFFRPRSGDIAILLDGSAQFVARFVRKNRGIFSIRKAGVGIDVRDQMMDILFEIIDESSVVIELHDFSIDRVRFTAHGGSQVNTSPTEEDEFPAMVVIVVVD